MRVLEVACGTGRNWPGPQGVAGVRLVLGLDISAECSQRAPRTGAEGAVLGKAMPCAFDPPDRGPSRVSQQIGLPIRFR